MKILGILGSPHDKGNTALLLDAVLDGAAKAGAETEKVGVAGLELNFCIACGKCHATGKCFRDDGAAMLQTKMMAADGIVLASPNYLQSISAQLKTVLDRFTVGIHCFLLDGKYGASVVTSGGDSLAGPAEYANQCMRSFGVQTVGALGAQGMGSGALVNQETVLAQAADLGRDLVAAINEKRQYPDQRQARAVFSERMKRLVTMTGDHAPFQIEHWRKMGWL